MQPPTPTAAAGAALALAGLALQGPTTRRVEL
ncbi:MAG: hypothetical protein QOD66_2550, partial [Solirubrobacteraceae bacterium]|nr:hypothetical protein [Solirubrobacteraceae bacterium]